MVVIRRINNDPGKITPGKIAAGQDNFPSERNFHNLPTGTTCHLAGKYFWAGVQRVRSALDAFFHPFDQVA